MLPGTGWNANNVYGVDFRAGIKMIRTNIISILLQKTELNIIILDEAGTLWEMFLVSVPGINVPELCKYAESKHVGIILWVVWKNLLG